MEQKQIKQRIIQIGLPSRFVNKLTIDIQYLLAYEIPTIEAILLFGSCARGSMKVTSDLDLLIITTKELERSMRGEISSDLEEPMDEISTDVIFYTREQYEESDRLIIQQIKQEGIILYEK